MDVNLLDRKFECNSATAAIASTATIASSPASINPDVIAPATMHPIVERAQPATNLTITHKYINSKKADILLIQLSIINGSMV